MPTPSYQVSTLIYCFDANDRVLLMKRSKSPNKGLWSPPGGKLDQIMGESPHQCAARESKEELGLQAEPADFHLTGMVSEMGYEGKHHWLMFLFEYQSTLSHCPPLHPEGEFAFISKDELERLDIPKTDQTFIWPMFWKYRHQFFTAHCNCLQSDQFEWQLHQPHHFSNY